MSSLTETLRVKMKYDCYDCSSVDILNKATSICSFKTRICEFQIVSCTVHLHARSGPTLSFFGTGMLTYLFKNWRSNGWSRSVLQAERVTPVFCSVVLKRQVRMSVVFCIGKGKDAVASCCFRANTHSKDGCCWTLTIRTARKLVWTAPGRS